MSVRKCCICGRRCLPSWVRVFDPKTGSIVDIKKLHENQNATVASLDSNSYTIHQNDDCSVSYSGEIEVFKVILQGGRSIDATVNSSFFTANGWIELRNLKLGDCIAVPKKLDYWGNKEIDDNDIKLLAYMIGDGNCTKKTIRFSQDTTTKQFEEMKKIVYHYGCELHHYESSDNPYDFGIRKIEERNNRTVANMVKETLIKYGIFGHDANTKFIPNDIFTLSKNQVAIFLSRLYSTDGWASTHTPKGRKVAFTEIGYCSNSETLIRDIAHLLLRFGIDALVRKKDVSWNVSIVDKAGILVFANEIGIYGKEEAVMECVKEALKKKGIDDFMPFEINDKIEKEMQSQGIKKAEIIRLWENSVRQQQRLRLNKYKLQKNRAYLIAKHLGMTDLKKLTNANILWKEIKSIKSIGVHATYNMYAPKYQNFIANDIFCS